MCKRVMCGLFSLLLAGGLVGCAALLPAAKRSETFMDVFDTVSVITAYGMDEQEFSADVDRLHEELIAYHRLYDIYHTYPNTVNLKTVNDAAGGAPVAVDSRIIDLLEYSLDAYEKTEGRVNILFGAVLELWHDSRETGLADPDRATLPSEAALTDAAEHVSPDVLVIDRAAGTVQITDPRARIDVGAIAKGYAVERAAQYAEKELGWESALLSVGGNVRAIGGKGNDPDKPYTVGIQNPDTDSAQTYLMTVNVTDTAVVTSGDYQRYYIVDGKRYAHIIDTKTLYPAEYVRSVSVVCKDSGMADILSTALFTMTVEQGLDLIKNTADAYAVWVLPDGSVRYSDGFQHMMQK